MSSPITMTLARNEFDNTTCVVGVVSWEDFAIGMTRHDRRAEKGEGRADRALGFSPAIFARGPCSCGAGPFTDAKGKAHRGCPDFQLASGAPPRGHRIARNVVAVTTLGADLDKNADGTELDADGAAVYLGRLRASGYAGVVHSTHSYAPPTKSNLRAFVQLSRPVTAHEWNRGFYGAAMRHLGIPSGIGDKPDPRRFWFAPSAPPDAPVLAEILAGRPLDVDAILATLAVAPPRAVLHAAQIEGALTLDSALAEWCPDAVIYDYGPDDRRATVECPNAASHTNGDRDAMVFDRGGVLGFKCLHGHCGDLDWRAFREYHEPPITDFDDVIATLAAKSALPIESTNAIALIPPPMREPLVEYGGSLRDYLGDGDPGDSADDWLVQGVVAAGVPQMTAGHPKAYKTFLNEHLAICVAAGLSWLGRTTKRGRVLILPREDSAKETRRRIWRLARGLGISDPRALEGSLWIDTLQPFYWTDRDQIAALCRTIDQRSLDLIVVDSLSRTHTGDENSVKDMLPVTNMWSDICQTRGAAISMIHHFTKSGTGTLLQNLRGSGNIGATLRHVVGVEKAHERGAPFELSFDGNLHPLPDPFSIRMLDGLDAADQPTIVFEHAGSNTALGVPKDLEGVSAVVRVMVESEFTHDVRKLSGAEIRKRTKLGTVACSAALKECELRLHYVERNMVGQRQEGWRLTNAGRAFYSGSNAGHGIDFDPLDPHSLRSLRKGGTQCD